MSKKTKIIITAIVVPILLIVGSIGYVTFAKIQEAMSLVSFMETAQKQTILAGETKVSMGTSGVKTEIAKVDHYSNTVDQITDIKISTSGMFAFILPQTEHVQITEQTIFISSTLLKLYETTMTGQTIDTTNAYYAIPNTYTQSVIPEETSVNSELLVKEIPKLIKGVPQMYTLKDDTLSININKDDIISTLEIMLRNAADNPDAVDAIVTEYNLPEIMREKMNKTNIEQTILDLNKQFSIVEKLDISIVIKNSADKTAYNMSFGVVTAGQTIDLTTTMVGSTTPNTTREQEPTDYVSLDFKSF